MEKKRVLAVNSAEFYIGMVILFGIVSLIKLFFPGSIPFDLFEFFKFSFSWERLQGIPWMLLLFGPVLTIFASIITKNRHLENLGIKASIINDFWTSIKAGIFEEAMFRWLIFFSLIAVFSFRDWFVSIGWIAAIFSLPWWAIILCMIAINIIGAFSYLAARSNNVGAIWSIIALIVLVFVIIIDIAAGFSIIKWWYTGVMLPIVNWITLGKMSPQLYSYGWMVGAALISSNWRFGNGHVYQGCVGWLNSWIIGMLMFWFTFNFGLLFAMLVHALYDIILHAIRYFDARIELLTTSV